MQSQLSYKLSHGEKRVGSAFMSAAVAQTTSCELVVFVVNGQKCALKVADVKRIVRAVKVTPWPNAPEIVLGVINCGGEIIPVFDLRRRLGFSPAEIGINDYMIIAGTTKRRSVLVAEVLVGVVEPLKSAIVGSDEVLDSPSGFEGALKLDGEIVFIYDLERFLSLKEEDKLDHALMSANGP